MKGYTLDQLKVCQYEIITDNLNSPPQTHSLIIKTSLEMDILNLIAYRYIYVEQNPKLL